MKLISWPYVSVEVRRKRIIHQPGGIADHHLGLAQLSEEVPGDVRRRLVIVQVATKLRLDDALQREIDFSNL